MAQWFSKANLGNLVNRAKEVVDKAKEVTKDAAKKVEAEIQKGQQQYLAEQQRVKRESEYIKSVKKGEGVVLPWETDDEELAILSQDVMERVLSLSLTEQNFSEVPPKLDLIPFVFTDNVATAMRLLALDANLARMHAKLSPKMHEEVFWQHYFFRILYIRLKLGIEIIDVESPLLPIKQIPEDDILYKPTFVPPPKPVKPVVINGLSSPGSKPMTPSSSSSQIVQQASPVAEEDNEEEDEEVDETAKKELEIRRKEEKALAAEVEGFLDNDDLDLGDLDEDDLGDLDDLAALDFNEDDVGNDEDLDDDDDDDDELEAAIKGALKGK